MEEDKLLGGQKQKLWKALFMNKKCLQHKHKVTKALKFILQTSFLNVLLFVGMCLNADFYICSSALSLFSSILQTSPECTPRGKWTLNVIWWCLSFTVSGIFSIQTNNTVTNICSTKAKMFHAYIWVNK